jgi:hypothetical protein
MNAMIRMKPFKLLSDSKFTLQERNQRQDSMKMGMIVSALVLSRRRTPRA